MKKNLILILSVSIMGCLILTSCLYGIRGSKKVVRNERQVEHFSSISSSAGIEVILIQDSVAKVVVEADDNLQAIIKTEV